MNIGYHILIYSNCYIKMNTSVFGLGFINFAKLSIILYAFNKVFHFLLKNLFLVTSPVEMFSEVGTDKKPKFQNVLQLCQFYFLTFYCSLHV